MKITIYNCARCGKAYHNTLNFNEFTIPVDDIDGSWTHWAMCPTYQEPILLKITDDKNQEEIGKILNA